MLRRIVDLRGLGGMALAMLVVRGGGFDDVGGLGSRFRRFAYGSGEVVLLALVG